MKIAYTFFLILVLGTACSEAQETDNYSLVSAADFEKQIKAAGGDVQLVDVRTPGEYGNGTINDAENIDFMDSDFHKNVKQLDLDRQIYLFCQSGGRSKKASDMLVEMGAKQVIELDGGYSSWSSR